MFAVFACACASAQPGSVGAWNSTQTFPYQIETPATLAFGGRIYVLGGYASGPGISDFLDNSVHVAAINGNGTLGSWTATTPFVNGRERHAAALDPDTRTIYVIGGDNAQSFNTFSDVQYARIQANGSVGTWAATTSLPAGLSGHKAFCHNGYLYIFRANDQFVGLGQGYYYAPIKSDGSVGNWTLGTLSFTVRRYIGAFAYNDHFYAIGGNNGSGQFNADFNEVRVARVPQRSSLTYLPMNETEVWNTTTPFQVARHLHGTDCKNGFVYITGGQTASSSYPDRSDVQYARILSDGSLSPWQTTTALPTALAAHACVADDAGHIYVIGGDYPSGGGFRASASVLYASIQSSSDTTPPKTQVSPSPGQQPSSPVTVTLTATDIGGSGVASIRRTTDGTDPNTSGSAIIVNSSSVTFSLPIPATLKFSARDAAGNVEQTQTAMYSSAQLNYVTAFQFPSDSRYPIDPLVEQTQESLWYDQQFVSNLYDPLPYHHYYRVAQDFGPNNPDIIPPPPYTESRHLGEDWNWGSGADDYKLKVHAIAKGTVVFAGPGSGWGRVIIIKHLLPPSFPDVPAAVDGSKFVNSLYGHLGSDQSIFATLNIRYLQKGDTVEDGEAIGYVGNTLENGGWSPHFHLEIRLPTCPVLNTPGPGNFPRDSVPDPTGWVDPSAFIKKHRASLPQIQMVASGGLTDATHTTPTISAGGSLVGFKNSPSFHLVDFSTGFVQGENFDGGGTLGNGELFTAVFSADSSVKAFASDDANLVANDTNGIPDVFVWTQTNGVTERVSVSTAGEQANGASYDVGMSADGRYVVFTSVATNLVANDTNGVTDVFVRDRGTNQTILVSVDNKTVHRQTALAIHRAFPQTVGMWRLFHRPQISRLATPTAWQIFSSAIYNRTQLRS